MYEWVVSHVYVWLVPILTSRWRERAIHSSTAHHSGGSSFTYFRVRKLYLVRVTWLIYMCTKSHTHMCHDSLIHVTWRIHMCDMTHRAPHTHRRICHTFLWWTVVPVLRDMTHSCVWHDSWICVPCLMHICAMIHSYVCHESFICVKWLVHMCDMTHLYVWHDWFICVTWLIHICDVTHSHVWRDSFICVTWLIEHTQPFWRLFFQIWIVHGTHTNESWYTSKWVTSRTYTSHGTHQNWSPVAASVKSQSYPSIWMS